MKMLFQYNWQVRQEWFDWCEQLTEQELLQERIGGMRSILRTLYHIVDVEHSWINDLRDQHSLLTDFADYSTLSQVRNLSDRLHSEVAGYVATWTPDQETKILQNIRKDGSVEQHTYGEVIRHVIAHEIHHIGQLSIWSRELGREPVSANLIRRGLASS